MTVIKRIALLTFFVLIMLPIHLTIAAPVDRPLMQPPNAYKSIDGTSEGHTSDLATATPADPYPLAIGEVITYRIVAEIPEGTSPDVQFYDTLAVNIEFIPGSARVSYSANNAFTGSGTVGINEINPTTAIPGGQITFGVTGPRELTFDLGQVVNNDSDLDTELLIVEYAAVVVNTSDNVAGATFANTFSIDLNNDGTDEDSSNEVHHVIVEPTISITKTVNTTLSNPTGTSVFDGGDTVVYDVVIANPTGANGATAFDLNMIDNIDPNLDLIDVDFIGAPAYSINADNSVYAPIQTVNTTISELRQGDSITVRVTVIVRSSVTIGQTIPNTANLTWTSLPGANGTGNATPGISGDTNGERNGNSIGENDYTRNSNETISIGGTVNTYKSIDGTSEGHTSDLATATPADPYPLAIGEVITYRIVAEIPEGTSPDVQFYDTLAVNIEFIPGSARVSYSANNAFTGFGTVGINEINPTTAIPGGQITFGVTGPRELTFDLGQVVNNDNDNDLSTELLIVEYAAVVVNTSDNTVGTTFANTFSIDLNNDGTDEDSSNDVYHVIVEPNLTITKTINTTLSNPTGTTVFNIFDTVVYDVVITNPISANGATAFDLNLIDNIDPNLDLIAVDFIGAPAYSINADNSVYAPIQTVNTTISELRQGDSITVRVTVMVMPSVTSGQTIPNTANLTWTSLPGGNGTGSATPGISGDTNGERNGNGTGENDYLNTANTSFSIFDSLPIKRIAGTSNSATDDTTADTPANPRPVLRGEIITYRLEAVLPESTTISFTLEDTLPIGLQFVAGSARVSYSANNSPTFGDATFSGIPNSPTPTFAFLFPVGNITFPSADEVRFNFGSIINNDGDANAEFIYLEFDALVLDDVVNGTGDIKSNQFDVIIDEGLPTETITTSNNVYAIIVEPILLVSKDDSQDPVTAGAIITYTVTINNPATANVDATNVVFTDQLPAGFIESLVTPSQGTCSPIVGGILTCNLGAIASGASASVIITGNYPATTISGTIVNNIAYVTSAEGIDGNDGNDTPTDNDDARAEESTTILREVDIAVSKTVDNPLPDEGDTITYSIEISNNGPSQATNVVMTDTIPMDMTFTSFTPISAPCVYAAPTLTCTYPIMDVGQLETLQIIATVDGGTSGTLITNTASATSTEPEANIGDNSDFVDVAVNGIDLSVSKRISTTAPQIGDFIVYTVTVQNDGAVDATGVELTDTLPSTVTYSGVYTASQGTFDGSVWMIGTIPPNGSAELLITVQVTSNVGTFVNVAEITAADQPDGDSTPNNGVTTEDDYAESVFIFDPPFGRKTFNDAGLPELEWSMVWVNPNGDPVDVTISDPLLAGTTFVAGSLTCTSPGTVTVNTCIYDALNNEIVFDGTIFPDFGATPATIDSATNRLIITYRVSVPDSVDTVFNEATLNNTNGDVVVSETFIRRPIIVTEEPPITPPTTSSADLALLATAKALPATGETPIWRDALWILGAVIVGMMMVGGGVYRRRVNSMK